MQKPATPVLSTNGEFILAVSNLFDIFPEPLFLIDAEKAKDYLVSLIDSGVTDIEKYLREHPIAVLKLANKVKFLDTNQAAVHFYQAQNKLQLLKELRSRESGRFQLSFSDDLTQFFEEKTKLEIQLNYAAFLGKPLHLKLKILFLNQEQPSFKQILLLVNDITEQVQIKKAQEAVYKISEYTHKVRDLPELYSFIHQTVNELVPAKNFYIALADYEKGLIEFPYTVDECDDRPEPIELGEGITSYVLKTGKPLLATPEVADTLIRNGNVISHGTESVDWLGVPLVTDKGIIGVLAVQTYTMNERLSSKDMLILQFVSTQIAMAIERKTAEEEISKFKTLSDSANYGIAILNDQGHFIYCNAHYAQMHGSDVDDILGRAFPLFEVLPEADKKTVLLETLHSQKESNVREVIHTHHDGHQFPVLLHIATIRGPKKQPLFTLLTAMDVSAQKQQNENLRRYAKRLETLHQIDQAILESRSPNEIAAAALGNLQKLIRLDHAGVVWIYGENHSSKLLAFYNQDAQLQSTLATHIEDHSIEMTIPPEMNVPVMKDLDSAKSLSPLEGLLKQAGIKSFLSVPLLAKDKLIGSLNLGAENTLQFTKENLEIIQEVARMLSIALQQSGLNQQIRKLVITDDLTKIYNRRQLIKLGQIEFKRAQRYHKPLSLIILDPDHF
ncbi:MAG: GAF domain-containing protein, partial [Anaerolineaceae bacterium]|nr:GAF domain-containing protein [Anaerolineaceae bacterium]